MAKEDLHHERVITENMIERVLEFTKVAFVADSAEMVFAKVNMDSAFVKLKCSDDRGIFYVTMLSESMFNEGKQ